jgi:hypothetical protein
VGAGRVEPPGAERPAPIAQWLRDHRSPVGAGPRLGAAVDRGQGRRRAGARSGLPRQRHLAVSDGCAVADRHRLCRRARREGADVEHQPTNRGRLAPTKRRQAAGEPRGRCRSHCVAARRRPGAGPGRPDHPRSLSRRRWWDRAAQAPGMPPGLPGSRDEEIAARRQSTLRAANEVVAGASQRSTARRPSSAKSAQASVGLPYSSGEVLLTVPLLDGGSPIAPCKAAGAAAAAAGTRRATQCRPPDAVTSRQAHRDRRAAIEADRTCHGLARAARDGLRRAGAGSAHRSRFSCRPAAAGRGVAWWAPGAT